MPSERVQQRINRLLEQADTAADQRDWARVRELAAGILAFDPANVEAQEYIAAADRAGATQSVTVPSGRASVRSAADSTKLHVAPASPIPASFASGRYTVKKFLGEGGKKRVYLAHDTVLDRDVAFALIKTEGLDDASRTRITREAQAMGRLGDHPNIMPIFDLGQETDQVTGVTQPFMVIPLMAGGDVEGVIEKAADHRMPLERALKITRETANGLTFAHSKGIVHRDLKPGNVWLTADGTARIGDFGLAVATDRSRLTREGMMVGTVAYMPPEQAMGGEITPRADLYSLGAMLYEMVTGRPPFLGDDDIAIIGQHINTPPVAPTWHRPDCPKPLDALIMRLLAKDPKQRPESAKDVLNALEAVNVSASAPQAPTPAKDGTPEQGRSLDSMSSGVFVGRQKEMDQLRAALEEALSGHGRMVTLVGEPGIGKTRTAQELATYAGLRRCQVLWGRCYEGGGAPPYWPWVQAIRQYAQEREPDQLRKEMGSTASVIAEVVPEVKERLPGLQPPPQLDSPESSRFRLLDSISAFLKGASRTQPIVLVLDDLHWSDKPSLLLLEFVAKELSNSRVLLVGTYRDMELSRQHPLSQTLGDLNRERLFTKVLLRGLSQEDVGKFIEMASGVKPPSGLVDAVQTQTEGNPLFVTEVVRLLVQEGHLARHDADPSPQPLPARGEGASGRGKRTTEIWTVRIPEGVKEVIGRRLNRLTARCNEVLTTASVIGREFSLEQLKATTDGLTEDMLLGVLEEALAARVIEELPHTVGRYQFTHALIQETLSNELSITRRVRLHARIAESLEKLYGDKADEQAAELAQHFAAAESVLGTEKLVHYSIAAGERAIDRYAFEEALQHFQRASDARKDLPLDETGAQILWGLGRAKAATAEDRSFGESLSTGTQEAWDIFARLFEFHKSKGDYERAVQVVTYPFATARVRGRLSVFEAALKMVPQGSREACRLMTVFALAYIFELGDRDRAQQLSNGALGIARNLGDKALLLFVLSRRALVVSSLSRPGDVMEAVREAADLAQQMPDMSSEWYMHLGAAVASLANGDTEPALRHAESAERLAEHLGNRPWRDIARWVPAQTGIYTGNWRLAEHSPNPALQLKMMELRGCEAHEFETAARRVIAEVRALHGTYVARNVTRSLSHTAAIHDDRRLIEECASLAESVCREVVEDQRDYWEAFCGLGQLLPLLGDQSRVARHYAAWKSEAGLFWPPLSANRELAHMALAMGHLEDAAKHFEDAISGSRKAGYKVELAYSLADYGDFLLEHGGGGAGQKARAMHDEALKIARDLGMKPLTERILKRRQFLKA